MLLHSLSVLSYHKIINASCVFARVRSPGSTRLALARGRAIVGGVARGGPCPCGPGACLARPGGRRRGRRRGRRCRRGRGSASPCRPGPRAQQLLAALLGGPERLEGRVHRLEHLGGPAGEGEAGGGGRRGRSEGRRRCLQGKGEPPRRQRRPSRGRWRWLVRAGAWLTRDLPRHHRSQA